MYKAAKIIKLAAFTNAVEIPGGAYKKSILQGFSVKLDLN